MSAELDTFADRDADSAANRLHARQLALSIKDHDICFVVPAGARIDAHRLDLPGGILVLGALRGRVFCASGSAIIAAGGEFQGELDAVNIYVEGKITSARSGPRGPSRLRARGVGGTQGVPAEGGLAAFGVAAHVQAHVQARVFHVPHQATFVNSIFEVIE